MLVVDAARGAMVYRRNSHGRHAAVHRASGWLAGGTPRERYNISAAALSPCGRFAVLKVHHLHKRASSLLVVQPEGQTVLKLFAADGFGQWSSSCEIAVLQGHGPGEQQDGFFQFDFVTHSTVTNGAAVFDAPSYWGGKPRCPRVCAHLLPSAGTLACMPRKNVRTTG